MKTFINNLSLAAVAATLVLSGVARAGPTLFAADNLTDNSLHGVVEFDSANLGVTGSFLTNDAVAGLATDGASVYASLPTGVFKYDTSGALQGSYTNAGADKFYALAMANGAVFAADNLTNNTLNGVVEFSSALSVTGAFLTNGFVAGLATDGTDIFASLPSGISEYKLDGTLIGTYSNAGADHFDALSFANGVLYAADNLTNNTLHGVVEFDGSLKVLSSFLTAGDVNGLASDGVDVYASLPTGVTEYTTAGLVVGSHANAGADHFGALALAPAAVPEPATWTVILLGLGMAGGALRGRSRAAGAQRA